MALYGDVVGQERAVDALRAAARAPVHAYLVVGPPGVGKRAAARSFAASLLCPDGGCGACGVCERVLAGKHADVRTFERTGASLQAGEIADLLEAATRSPREAARQVLVVPDVHLIAQQYPKLLKTVEEPPATTVFVLLAETVPPELVTIASRCVRVDLGPVPDDALRAALVAEGVDQALAADVARAAGGRLDRARLLATDPGFSARRALWESVPARLDGTGAAVAVLAAELLASVDELAEPVRRLQEAELAAAEADAERYGQRFRRSDMVDRHKRELRRLLTDELRAGLATLAEVYRHRLAGAPPHEARRAITAVEAIGSANQELIRNPNTELLLQALLVRLTG